MAFVVARAFTRLKRLAPAQLAVSGSIRGSRIEMPQLQQPWETKSPVEEKGLFLSGSVRSPALNFSL